MRQIILLIILFGNVSVEIQAQCQFDSDEGCLNTVNFSTGPGLGEYGDRNLSVSYAHEKFLTDQFSVGVGIVICLSVSAYSSRYLGGDLLKF